MQAEWIKVDLIGLYGTNNFPIKDFKAVVKLFYWLSANSNMI